MRSRLAVPCAVLAFTVAAPVARAADAPVAPQGSCVDEEAKKELIGGRHYRGVQPRLFTKSFRHELSGLGGWRAGDQIDGAPWYGGTYTFHFSEELGLEAGVGFSRARSRIADTLQARNPLPVELYQNDRKVKQYLGHLVWSLAYGKLRWLGGGISRFDFHIAMGGGITDDELSRGLTGSFGLGGKLYLTSWLAMRFDVRDQVYSQKILDDRRIVNDILVTGGLSIFFPFSG